MIEIDGSYGEGGGAIVRVSTALSAVTGKPVHISNIRSGRPKGGLMPQHLHAVGAVAQLCQADVEGLKIGSQELFFYPNSLGTGDFSVDVGTAGSISLVLESFMIPAFAAKEPVTITARGGTDVHWSPPIDYLENVTLPILGLMGCHAQLKILKRGYYPPGGGLVQMEIYPTQPKPLKLDGLQVEGITGLSHASKLPHHVAIRQAEAAVKILEEEGYDPEIRIENYKDTLSPGSGIVLWTTGSGGRVGGSSLGKRGKRAEMVGEEAAMNLLDFIHRGVALDKYMGDQIIPYLAWAGKSGVKVSEITPHTRTNIKIAELLTGAEFRIEELKDEPSKIIVE
jgi:RNA 3'-phosphate cyclase